VCAQFTGFTGAKVQIVTLQTSRWYVVSSPSSCESSSVLVLVRYAKELSFSLSLLRARARGKKAERCDLP
jgi:hypothetical protein